MRRRAIRRLSSFAGTAALGTILSVLFWREYRRSRRAPIPAVVRDREDVFGDRFEQVHNAPEGVMVLGRDLTIRYANPAVERSMGYDLDALIGAKIFEYLHPDDLQPLLHDLGDSSELAVASRPLEFRVRHADGSWCHMQAVNIYPLDTGMQDRAYSIRDVTGDRVVEDELRRRAFFDPLTGLANRSLFMDRLEHALVRGVRQQHPVSVLFVDMDNFKAVNDSLGHEAGDRVLVTVAQRLQACSRPEDTVARFGGDEFTILLEDATGASSAISVAERIEETLRPPITLPRESLFVTASTGIASSGTGLHEAEDLLRAADTAMYQAKRNRNGSYEIFGSNMPEEALKRLELERDLRRAVAQGEFRLHYQPEVLLGSEKIVGMEALLRWDYPRRGLLSPAEFISSVERTGLIVPIGQWILEEACRQATSWQEQYPGASPWISVNISARQIQQPGLVQKVAGVLQETGLKPESLVLEITENLVMEDTKHVADTLRMLKDLGVRLAIDDFGTGYSSLAYLERLPADLLKIDQSFVDRLGREDGNTATLVSALVDVSQAFGIQTVAEGVETPEQLEELRDMRCEMGQGYYFSRPLPTDEASALLQAASGV